MSSGKRFIHRLLKVTDLAVIVIAFMIAVGWALGGSEAARWFEVLQMRITVRNALFVAAYLGTWHFVLAAWGLYHSYRLAPARRELRRLAIAVTIAVFPLWPAGTMLNFQYATPTFIMAFACLSFALLALQRRLIRSMARSLRKNGLNTRNVVLVGEPPDLTRMGREFQKRSDLGYTLLDPIVLSADDRTDNSEQAFDTAADHLEALAASHGIDEVFVVLPFDGTDSVVRRLISYCEEQGIMVRVLTQIADLTWAHVVVDEFAGQPVLSIFSGPRDSSKLVVKRMVDLVGATCGIILTLPIMLIAAVAIKLDSDGPILFRQERVGLNQRRFITYKFRTMKTDADDAQKSLEHLNEADGPVFKIKNDPRITEIGEFLRRSSIDELPQLFNVLRGDMSLVGPRPLPVRDVEKMSTRWHKRRFAVKPGITCIWQATSREPKFDEWIRSDMEYIDSWSLSLDFKILLQTIPAVILRQGAV